MGFYDYIRLIRFKYHITFIPVIIGALAFSTEFSYALIKSLFLLYIAFNIFLYGGLYTFNDLLDFKKDSEHSLKKKRPLPSGRINLKPAKIFSIIFVLLGLTMAFFYFGMEIVYVFLTFIILNIIYSTIAKHIAYVDIFFNGITHLLRLLMGILLVTPNLENKIYLLLIAYYCLAVGVIFAMRIMEKDIKGWEARKVLKNYTPRIILTFEIFFFIIILLLTFLSYPTYFYLYMLIGIAYLFIMLGINLSSKVRHALVMLMMRNEN